ncbi:MAG: acetyl-CoA carboxylase carboxyltransferase subunit alpha [Puniceicoccales bacterium]|jgi:acetyl-CoA carboxylase carboxyl transferase subunit alpha|nr:acetyl-CoA carboxylase carboxyltransferase subunit alpha [Puniceicoccales bacterium]
MFSKKSKASQSPYILEFEKPLRELKKNLDELIERSRNAKVDISCEISALEQKISSEERNIFANLSTWQRILIARHPNRPYSLDYINSIFSDFQELHGDRLFGDDRAIMGGFATLNGEPLLVIGQQKGRSLNENIECNFGCPYPEGYRKALRLMKLGEKFSLPIVTFIDTAGAYPGIGSEERHIAEAIAVNLRDMGRLETPIISIVIGEGGSGGALGIAVSDRVLILENAYYSVISPEGCAAILWKDRKFAPEAAEALQLSPENLIKLGIAEEIIPEPLGGAHRNPNVVFMSTKDSILRHLKVLKKLSPKQLLEKRYDRFRSIGIFSEEK